MATVYEWPPKIYCNFYDDFHSILSVMAIICAYLYTFMICLISFKEFLRSGYREYSVLKILFDYWQELIGDSLKPTKYKQDQLLP